VLLRKFHFKKVREAILRKIIYCYIEHISILNIYDAKTFIFIVRIDIKCLWLHVQYIICQKLHVIIYVILLLMLIYILWPFIFYIGLMIIVAGDIGPRHTFGAISFQNFNSKFAWAPGAGIRTVLIKSSDNIRHSKESKSFKAISTDTRLAPYRNW